MKETEYKPYNFDVMCTHTLHSTFEVNFTKSEKQKTLEV